MPQKALVYYVNICSLTIIVCIVSSPNIPSLLSSALYLVCTSDILLSFLHGSGGILTGHWAEFCMGVLTNIFFNYYRFVVPGTHLP